MDAQPLPSLDEPVIMPTTGTLALRTLGILTRYTPDRPISAELVIRLQKHIVPNHTPNFGVLESFKLVVLPPGEVFLTEYGAKVAKALVSSPDEQTKIDDIDLYVMMAMTLDCFARSHDADNKTCQNCPVRLACQESFFTCIGATAQQLLNDDRLAAEQKAREIESAKKEAERDAARAERKAEQDAAPEIGNILDRLNRAADKRDAKP